MIDDDADWRDEMPDARPQGRGRKPREHGAGASGITGRLREVFRRGRGRSIARIIEETTPILRGWIAYFRLMQTRGIFEDLDRWFRRKLRTIAWRQWKRPKTRMRKMTQQWIDRARAWKSANNRCGPWRNAGAAHMNHALKTFYFRKLGLTPMTETLNRLNHAS